MAFYCPDRAMGEVLEELLRRLEAEGRPGLAEQVSITWLRYAPSWRLECATDSPRAFSPQAFSPQAFWERPRAGASWQGDRPRYPASVVKLFYLAAAEAWLQRQLIEESAELRRALTEMIANSSNDATSLVVDLLSGSSSGPDLSPKAMALWVRQRQLVNDWLSGLEWPELAGCNVCQKTWGDGPFGRERQFYGEALENRNRLSTDATARLLHALMGGAFLSPPASQRMQQLLARSLDEGKRLADPENQVDGFIGQALPPEAQLWSKAGWMSQARHDAAYVERQGRAPFLLVIFSEGAERAADVQLLPELTAGLADAMPDLD
ncbi:MAG: serine hydrolase [Prochlorococcaceae cyanobacterium]